MTLKRPGHHFLSQTFEAIHLGWHQALAAVAAAALADTAPHSLARLNGLVAMRKGQPFTQSCSFTWRDDGDGAAAVTCFMHILCVICAVAREAGHLFRCWVFVQAAQPLLANHPPREWSRRWLQSAVSVRLCPDAPCATGDGAMLLGFPFTFPQALDAHGVSEQMQAVAAWTGVHLNLQPLQMLKSPRAFNAAL